MAHILTVMIERTEQGSASVNFVASDGLPMDVALLACRAVEQALQERIVEAEVQRRVKEKEAEHETEPERQEQ